MQKTIFLIPLAALLLSSCSMALSTPDLSTSTPFIITVTLPVVSGPPLTGTPAPTSLQPSAEPVEGTTASQVYVRLEPSSASTPLAIIAPNIKVQIVGKDPGGNWAQIVFPQAPNGRGWLTMQYLNVKDPSAIPVIGVNNSSEPGPSAVVIQQVNVRSGPGTDFKNLGILNPKDAVALIGKDASGVWLQIQFASGPDGKGWITAAYVKASGIESLPIIGGSGQLIGTGTPTSIPLTITPTIVPAPQDNDSAGSPAANVIFSPSGAHSLIYSSDVSTPSGDSEDWIQFTPYSADVNVSLTCTGNGDLKVELWQNGAQLPGWGSLVCGGTAQLVLSQGQPYLVHLLPVPHGGDLVYVHYVINIESTP